MRLRRLEVQTGSKSRGPADAAARSQMFFRAIPAGEFVFRANGGFSRHFDSYNKTAVSPLSATKLPGKNGAELFNI
jgi:hypothetical protein